MSTPDTTVPLIYKAMGAIQADVQPVAKDQKNEDQGYAFRGIAGVAEMLHPLLAKHGVVALPRVMEQERHDVPTRSGGVMHVAILTVAWHFTANDGSEVIVITVGEGADTGDKATNKAMTASQKYALTLAFTVPFGDQADGDASDPGERASRSSQQQRREPAPASSVSGRLAEGQGITEGKAKRAIAIAIQTGEREGCHGFEVIGSVLKGANIPRWAGKGDSSTVIEHLCSVIPWKGKSYDNFIDAIEKWVPESPPDEEPPPPASDDDIPF